MGLDSIEILLDVENTFDIKIPDAEAQRILTIGEFHEAVWSHLNIRQSDHCNSQVVFYRLRAAICECFSVSRKQVTLQSSPNMLFPGSNRRKEYKKLQSSLNWVFPSLTLPNPWSRIFGETAAVFLLGSILVELILVLFFKYSPLIFLWTIALTGIGLLFSTLIEPFRTNIDQPDMKSFVNQILALNLKKIMDGKGISRAEMELVIVNIISNRTGIDLSEITPEKRIGDDLGID